MDPMEEQMLQSSQNFLRVLDKFNDFNVTGFVTSDNLKFLLLHKQRSEDSIRRFFHDVRDLYLKVLLNPFYDPKTLISNSQFEARVQSLARLHLH